MTLLFTKARAHDENAQESPFASFTHVPAAPSAPAFQAPVQAGEANDVHALVSELRHHMEAFLSKELSRVEDSVGGLLRQREAELATQREENARLRAEHDRIKAEHERKTEALTALKRALEGI